MYSFSDTIPESTADLLLLMLSDVEATSDTEADVFLDKLSVTELERDRITDCDSSGVIKTFLDFNFEVEAEVEAVADIDCETASDAEPNFDSESAINFELFILSESYVDLLIDKNSLVEADNDNSSDIDADIESDVEYVNESSSDKDAETDFDFSIDKDSTIDCDEEAAAFLDLETEPA